MTKRMHEELNAYQAHVKEHKLLTVTGGCTERVIAIGGRLYATKLRQHQTMSIFKHHHWWFSNGIKNAISIAIATMSLNRTNSEVFLIRHLANWNFFKKANFTYWSRLGWFIIAVLVKKFDISHIEIELAMFLNLGVRLPILIKRPFDLG